MFKFNFESNETNEIDEFEEETRTDRSDFGFLTFDEIQIDEENLKIKEKLELFQSDLVPSVYEGLKSIFFHETRKENINSGGLKTWECSHDLVDFVKTIIEQIPPGTSVLEVSRSLRRKLKFDNLFFFQVGCGSALPGLEMARASRFNVDFQDFVRFSMIDSAEKRTFSLEFISRFRIAKFFPKHFLV